MAESTEWEDVFYQQSLIQYDVYGHRFSSMTDTEKIVFIKEMVLSMTHELHEALDETGWKGWSTSRHLNTELYLRELVDVQLMLVNLFLVTGVHAGELAGHITRLMRQKQQVNIERQESGYSA